MKLSADQRKAIQMLASSHAAGATEALLLAHGFTIEQLAELVHAGLVTAMPERVRSGSSDKVIEVTRVRITEAGRRALQAK
jgi:hypothetical protein